MKLLSSILKRIEAGGEDVIRSQLDEAIGMWAADHGSAHTIVAVSEDSVAFADGGADLFVARYAIAEGVVALTKVRRLLNIAEQATNTDHLDDVAAKVVAAVIEDREADVNGLVSSVLEMKQDAMRVAGMAKVANPMDAQRSFGKKANKARFGVAQKAKKVGMRESFLASRELRQALADGKVAAAIAEAVKSLPGAANKLIASIVAERNSPVAEGFIVEMADCGVPTKMKKKGAKYAYATPAKKVEEEVDPLNEADEETRKVILEAVKKGKKVEVHVYDAPAAKDVKGKFHATPRHTGKGHSVRYRGKSYRLHGGDRGKGKIYLADRAYHGIANRKNAVEKRETNEGETADQKWDGKDLGNPLDLKGDKKLIQGGQGKKLSGGDKGEKADVSEAGAKFNVVSVAGGKWQVQKTGEDGVMSIAGDYDTAEGAAEGKLKFEKVAVEGVILANLAVVNESFDTKDFFYRTGVTWAQFRSEGIGAAAVELLEKQGEPVAVLEASPLLALCSEAEVYDLLAPHLDAFDPASIRKYSKQVFEAAQTEDSKKARVALLDELADDTIKEAILAAPTMSVAFDQLFLEGDGFDFGAADDLGNDDLGDDANDDGLEDAAADDDADGLGDDLDGMGDDDLDGGFDDQPVQFELPSGEARDMFRKILDVVANEIEDDEEFNALKARIDDEGQELSPDDVTTVLHVIGDYFQAVGKDNADQDEAEEDKKNGDETMDDMDGQTNTPADDTEGDAAGATDPGEGLGDLDGIGA